MDKKTSLTSIKYLMNSFEEKNHLKC